MNSCTSKLSGKRATKFQKFIEKQLILPYISHHPQSLLGIIHSLSHLRCDKISLEKATIASYKIGWVSMTPLPHLNSRIGRSLRATSSASADFETEKSRQLKWF